MSLTPSNMIELGTTAPDFTLINTIDEKSVSLNDVQGENGTLIIFMCNHCPFVVHVMEELVALCHEYQEKGFGVVAISSNDVMNYPQDSPGKMRMLAEELEFNFPYLYDEDQSVAKAYDAACTPDFYVFDSQNTLKYRGRMDESRPGNGIPVTGKDLREAMDAIAEGEKLSPEQFPSMGCNIKWK